MRRATSSLALASILAAGLAATASAPAAERAPVGDRNDRYASYFRQVGARLDRAFYDFCMNNMQTHSDACWSQADFSRAVTGDVVAVKNLADEYGGSLEFQPDGRGGLRLDPWHFRKRLEDPVTARRILHEIAHQYMVVAKVETDNDTIFSSTLVEGLRSAGGDLERIAGTPPTPPRGRDLPSIAKGGEPYLALSGKESRRYSKYSRDYIDGILSSRAKELCRRLSDAHLESFEVAHRDAPTRVIPTPPTGKPFEAVRMAPLTDKKLRKQYNLVVFTRVTCSE